MKTGKTSLLGRLSGVFSIALVALTFSIGGSYVVRAEQPETLPSTLREMVFVPIVMRSKLSRAAFRKIWVVR